MIRECRGRGSAVPGWLDRGNNWWGRGGGTRLAVSPPLPKSYFPAPIGFRIARCPGCPRTEQSEHLLKMGEKLGGCSGKNGV